jgi:hypothetical protein
MRIHHQQTAVVWARRTAALVLVACVGMPLGGSAAGSGAGHEFGVNGKAVLCPLESDMDPALIPYSDESTDLAVGSGHTPGFGFLFGADEVQKQVGNGRFHVRPELDDLPHVNTLGGSVGFLSAPDYRRLGSAMRARDLSDEWLENGHCPRVVVTPLQGNLFEVKCAVEDKYANILNRAPERRAPMPDPNSVVVATCLYETISVGKFAGQELRSCRRVVKLDGFLVDYQIQENNLPLYLQIDAFLRNKIAEWKVRCSSSRV